MLIVLRGREPRPMRLTGLSSVSDVTDLELHTLTFPNKVADLELHDAPGGERGGFGNSRET